MSGHTKGPWRVGSYHGQCNKPEHGYNHPGPHGDNPCVYEPVFSSGGGIAGANGRNVIDVEYGDLVVSDEDLCLIAAAPDLLEALSETFDMLGSRLLKDTFGYDWHEKSKAAIAKARGEK